MFSTQEKNKIYRLLEAFCQASKTECIADYFSLEELNCAKWEFEDFMDFLLREKYIDKSQYNFIKRVNERESNDYPEEAVTIILEDRKIFNLWYVNYISSTEPSFEDFYVPFITYLRKKINDSPIVKTFYNDNENLEKWIEENISLNIDKDEEKAYVSRRILTIEEMSLVNEYIEMLSEVATNELEINIIEKLKNIFE